MIDASNGKCTTRRKSSIELLRIIMMFLIIILHLSGTLYPTQKIINNFGNRLSIEWCVIRSITFLGVTTFMFISSYFGIKFNAKKLINLWLKGVIIGIISFLIAKYIFKINCGESIRLLMPISSGTWWYLSGYILLMILSPIINKGLDNLRQKDFLIIVILCIIYKYIGCYIFHDVSTNIELLFTIYIIGRYLKKFPIRFIIDNSLIIHIVTLSIIIITSFIIPYNKLSYKLSLYIGNLNILVLLSSISLFYTFNKKSYNINFINMISKRTFDIYLIHAYVPTLTIIGIYCYNLFSNNSIINILVVAFIVFNACYIIGVIIDFLINTLILSKVYYIAEIISDKIIETCIK